MKYRKPYLEQLQRIQRLGKYDLASNIRDLTGWSLREAEMALDAVVASVAIWHQAIIGDIPVGSKAEISFRGFGTFIVTFGISYRPGNGNRTRRRQGLPAVPKLEVDFIPATELAAMVKNINRQIKQDYDAIIDNKNLEGDGHQLLEKSNNNQPLSAVTGDPAYF